MVRFWREGEWQHTALLWGWTGIYFLWQSLAKNPTMRYQLLIYPTLGIFAAWAVFTLWDAGKRAERGGRALRLLAGVIGAGVLLATYGWAYAFTISVYNQPVTRIAATRLDLQKYPRADQSSDPNWRGSIEPADFFPILLLHSAGHPLSNQFQAAEGWHAIRNLSTSCARPTRQPHPPQPAAYYHGCTRRDSTVGFQPGAG